MVHLKLLSTLALALIGHAHAQRACTTSTFASVTGVPGNFKITVKEARLLTGASNTFHWPGYSPTTDPYLPAYNLPPVCAVAAVVEIEATSTEPRSNYTVGLLLPHSLAAWNGRMLTTGGGSFGGGINWNTMGEGLRYGFASLSTNGGHQSDLNNMTWAKDDSKLLDWGYRAMNGTVLLGKLFVKHYYQKAPEVRIGSYYTGCSTAGRQGLRQIQADASSFDGALIGAPAYDTRHQVPFLSHVAKEILDKIPQGFVSPAQWQLLSDNVTMQCDVVPGIDDIPDLVVSAPDECTFDFSQISCETNPLLRNCFSKELIDVIRGSFWKPLTVQGTNVSQGFTKTSALGLASFFFDRGALTGFDMDYWRTFMRNDSFNYTDYDSNTLIPLSTQRNPGNASVQLTAGQLNAFRNRPPATNFTGGKIIMYHGTADGLVPTRDTTALYNKLETDLGSNATDMRTWFRYFQVPGMQHCLFGVNPPNTPADVINNNNATWYFGAPGQAAKAYGVYGDGHSVVGHINEPDWDALAALVRWVEQGTAPERINAGALNQVGAQWQWAVTKTLPLCPYPKRAVPLNPNSVTKDQKDWTCQ